MSEPWRRRRQGVGDSSAPWRRQQPDGVSERPRAGPAAEREVGPSPAGRGGGQGHAGADRGGSSATRDLGEGFRRLSIASRADNEAARSTPRPHAASRQHLAPGRSSAEASRSTTSSAAESSGGVDEAGLGDLEDGYGPAFVGTCEDMCPGTASDASASEREVRERLHDISAFERAPGGDRYTTSPELAVKKFSRTLSKADLVPSNIRSLPALQRTMRHLLQILDDPGSTFSNVYEFVFDRTRAVRQELSMQRISGKAAIDIYGPIVRFHIMASYEMCEVSESAQYDGHLNVQQLSKSLAVLLSNLDAVAKQGLAHCDEGEYSAYNVLLNLGPLGSQQAESLALWFASLRPSVLHAPEMRFARYALRCYGSSNYYQVCRLAASAAFLPACLLHLHLGQIRHLALAIINHGCYTAHPFPLSDLAQLLLFEDPLDVAATCHHYGLAVGPAGLDETPALLVKETQMKTPISTPNRQQSKFLQDKRRGLQLSRVCLGL